MSGQNGKMCWGDLKRKVKVYDIESKTLIAEFDSVKDAQKHFGITSAGGVASYIKTKCRCYKNNTGKPIAFR